MKQKKIKSNQSNPSKDEVFSYAKSRWFKVSAMVLIIATLKEKNCVNVKVSEYFALKMYENYIVKKLFFFIILLMYYENAFFYYLWGT